MVNIVVINKNTSTDNVAVERIKNALEVVFKYTEEVNVHLLLNLKSPVDTLGVYDYLFFIEIPYRKGNYYRTIGNVYLNNIVFAIRNIKDPSIVQIKNGKLYTSNGEFDYNKQILQECSALKQYVFDNIPSVQHFDMALYYSLEAPNCSSKVFLGNLLCNVPRDMRKLVSKTVDNLKGDKNGTTCLYLNKDSGYSMSDFISSFIELLNSTTNNGILTKKKIDAISTKEIGKQMQMLSDTAGEKLSIVKGKAGTGKTLSLLRFMYSTIQKHHCRLLTFNNLLVMDTKLALRNMGQFTPMNSSVTTLHKFFYNLFIETPVRSMHMDEEKINVLFNLCHKRVSKLVVLIEEYLKDNKFTSDAYSILQYCKNKNMIDGSDEKEMRYFAYYLKGTGSWSLENLHEHALNYEYEKRERFIKMYGQTAFLSGYRIIMEELYLLFHNSDLYIDKFGQNLLSAPMNIRESLEFKKKYGKLYNDFIEQCKKDFSIEHGVPDELFSRFIIEEENLINHIKEENIKCGVTLQKDDVQKSIKTIKRKVNWSRFVLVDEAQDCANYEKELLMELFGSSNVIIASGGKDQLIRIPTETHWDLSFGNRLDSQVINLTHVSHRQKGNIVEFINAFSKDFSLDTELSVPDSIKGTGRVVIDMRNGINNKSMPLDVINNLITSGSDYGCCPYESLMFLFPNEGFTKVKTEGNIVNIDENNTIDFDGQDRNRVLNIHLSEEIKVLDCTINGKSHLFNEVGYDKTRCLLYESCRGLEAWSVMCMGLDVFFNEKRLSSAASEYADEALGFFKDDKELREVQCNKYAALWLLMAFTRAMDTMYISFAFPNSAFASRIEKIGSQLPFVEIIR